MSRPATSPPPTPARLRGVVVLAAAAALAALLLLSSHSVPEGSHAFRRLRGASSWSLLDPGLRFSIPILQQMRVVADEVTVRRQSAGVPGEAGPDYAVTVRLTREALEAAALRGLTPAEYAAAHVEEILSGAGGLPADELLRAELPARGFADPIVRAGGSGERAPRRSLRHPILLVGLDGADWQVAEPLMAAGRLPVLASLRERGAWGHLRSSSPMLSPLLWTTAATGKPPDEHGIVDFLVPDPATGRKVPISSSFRKVNALWNIFGDRGLSSTFVAWWATYPAEPVRGEMISDRVAYSLFDVGRPEGSTAGLVHPPGLWESVSRRIVDAARLPDEAIRGIAEVEPAEIEEAREIIRGQGEGASSDRLVHLMKIVAGTMTYHAIALDRIAAGQPDLLGVYYQGIDEVSHRFAHCAPPAMEICAPGDARRYGGTVAAFYAWQDRLLGELLEAAGPDSFVVVISDHGFRNGGDRPRDLAPDIDGKPAKWHRLYGVAAVAGPGIPPGRLDSVTLADVAPTVLRLAGLPRAADMRGTALVSPPSAGPPPEEVATYGTRVRDLAMASPEARGEGAGQEAMLENLRSLGYIGGGAAPAGAAPSGGPTPSTVTAHTNVGALHMQKGEIAEAEREFTAALGLAPRYLPALMGLAEVRIAQERPADAFEIYGRALRLAGEPEPGAYSRYAGIAAHLGKAAEAEGELRRLLGEREDAAEIHVALAVLAESAGRTTEAGERLLRALSIDPASTDAMARLFRIRRESLTEATLEPAIRRALEINPASVLHLNWLGLILERRGDAAGAERQFRQALSIAPDFGGTMANLGSLCGRTGRLDEAVDILSRALRIEPDNLESRVNLGAALGKLGRPDEALAVLEEGRRRAPRSPEILNALAVTWAQKGDTDRAIALFRESLGIRSHQPRVRAMLQEIEAGE